MNAALYRQGGTPLQINGNYRNLQPNYLFSTVTKRVAEERRRHPGKPIYRLGVGDVTLPLCPAVIGALGKAVEEMSAAETFRGYGPEQGYDFLRERIQQYYAAFGVALDLEEIFVSDGANSDLGNILDLFSKENTALIPDPVYPVYLDTNTMDGRKVLFMDGGEENDFLPLPDPSVKADLIYLCSPGNPTGAVYTRAMLQSWVDYARARGVVILFDAAYESFVTGDLPHSIYEVEGAKECAIEISSLSKTAGFTGMRCGYTVVPRTLEREGMSLNRMWLRRQTTKFNGVSYVVQRGAAAVFTPEGRRQTGEATAFYRENAALIAAALRELGVWFTGGVCSPYIWMACPEGMGSWEFFDLLLREAGVAGVPGAGFGRNGEGYFRLTGFGSREETCQAIAALQELYRARGLAG